MLGFNKMEMVFWALVGVFIFWMLWTLGAVMTVFVLQYGEWVIDLMF